MILLVLLVYIFLTLTTRGCSSGDGSVHGSKLSATAEAALAAGAIVEEQAELQGKDEEVDDEKH